MFRVICKDVRKTDVIQPMSISNEYICKQCILEVDNKSYLILDDDTDKFFASTKHANDMKNKKSSYYRAVRECKGISGETKHILNKKDKNVNVEKIGNDIIFTFDKNAKFESVKYAGYSEKEDSYSIEFNPFNLTDEQIEKIRDNIRNKDYCLISISYYLVNDDGVIIERKRRTIIDGIILY